MAKEFDLQKHCENTLPNLTKASEKESKITEIHSTYFLCSFLSIVNKNSG